MAASIETGDIPYMDGVETSAHTPTNTPATKHSHLAIPAEMPSCHGNGSLLHIETPSVATATPGSGLTGSAARINGRTRRRRPHSVSWAKMEDGNDFGTRHGGNLSHKSQSRGSPSGTVIPESGHCPLHFLPRRMSRIHHRRSRHARDAERHRYVKHGNSPMFPSPPSSVGGHRGGEVGKDGFDIHGQYYHNGPVHDLDGRTCGEAHGRDNTRSDSEHGWPGEDGSDQGCSARSYVEDLRPTSLCGGHDEEGSISDGSMDSHASCHSVEESTSCSFRSDPAHPTEDYHNPNHSRWNPYYVDPHCQGQLVFDLPYGPDETGDYHTANNLCAGMAMAKLVRGEAQFANCCLMRLQRTNMTYMKMATLDLKLHKCKERQSPRTVPTDGNEGRRHRIDVFLNQPGSSFKAKLWATFTTALVLLSVLVFSLETTATLSSGSSSDLKRKAFVSAKAGLREMPAAMRPGPAQSAVKSAPQPPPEMDEVNTTESVNGTASAPAFNQAALVMEFTTVGILTAELLVRFAVSPDRLAFVRSPLNVAEFLSFTISILLLSLYQSWAGQGAWHMMALVVLMKVIRLLRLARVLRNYPPIKVILQTILGSRREIALLYTVVFLCTAFYATLIFFVELEQDLFMSIPEGYWWALTTLTTVGYGDYVPRSALGMVVGSACSITGILLVVIIVPIISNNFVFYYEYFYRYDAHPNMSSKPYTVLLGRRADDSDDAIAISPKAGRQVPDTLGANDEMGAKKETLVINQSKDKKELNTKRSRKSKNDNGMRPTNSRIKNKPFHLETSL